MIYSRDANQSKNQDRHKKEDCRRISSFEDNHPHLYSVYVRTRTTDIGNTRWVILTTSPSWIGWNWNVLVVARLDGKVCVQMWIMSSFILEFDTWIAGSPSNIHTMSMIDRYKSQLFGQCCCCCCTVYTVHTVMAKLYCVVQDCPSTSNESGISFF